MSLQSIYADLTDEELAAKIQAFRTAYEQAASGGVAAVVAGEGRRIEYTKANISGLVGLLNLALKEQQRRTGAAVDGAIRIEWP